MSIPRLSALVALLVLCTGLAVGFYVDALRADPVHAAETGVRAPVARAAETRLWTPVRDDVRTGSSLRKRTSPAARKCESTSPCPSRKRTTTREATSSIGVVEWVERFGDVTELPAASAGVGEPGA